MWKTNLNKVGKIWQSPHVKLFAVIIVIVSIWHITLWRLQITDSADIRFFLFLFDLVLGIAAFLMFEGLVYFFSQFVLPIQNKKDRKKIYQRVKKFASGERGPALFIKNGRIIEHKGEREKKGPGVLLLDTASAAVLQTDIEFGDTVGPGVKFTEVRKSKDKKGGSSSLEKFHRALWKSFDPSIKSEPVANDHEKREYAERLSDSADLRAQWKFVGPMAGTGPILNPLLFDIKKPKESAQASEEYNSTKGWTRDGFEVIATLSIKYRIKQATKRRSDGGVLSHYGFDPQNARKAIIQKPLELKTLEDKRELLPWDKLPEHLVNNIWREELGRFKLNELFSSKTEGESNLHVIARRINNRVKSAGGNPSDGADDFPRAVHNENPEYRQLSERGIEITEVKIYNIQLDEDNEEKIASRWSGEWLNLEKKEAGLLDQLEAYNEANVPKEAVKRFAWTASKYFTTPRNPRPDNFTLLQALLEPLIEAVKARTPVDEDQKELLQTLNAVWKWLVAAKPAGK